MTFSKQQKAISILILLTITLYSAFYTNAIFDISEVRSDDNTVKKYRVSDIENAGFEMNMTYIYNHIWQFYNFLEINVDNAEELAPGEEGLIEIDLFSLSIQSKWSSYYEHPPINNFVTYQNLKWVLEFYGDFASGQWKDNSHFFFSTNYTIDNAEFKAYYNISSLDGFWEYDNISYYHEAPIGIFEPDYPFEWYYNSQDNITRLNFYTYKAQVGSYIIQNFTINLHSRAFVLYIDDSGEYLYIELFPQLFEFITTDILIYVILALGVMSLLILYFFRKRGVVLIQKSNKRNKSKTK